VLFWNQAGGQGFRPSIGKALLFPSAVQALGKNGNNLSKEVWWSPNHPFKSSLNGLSAKQIAHAYQRATGRQWTQPIGFTHALFEVGADVMKRADSVGDPAIQTTKLETLVGPIAWDGKNTPPFAQKKPVERVSSTTTRSPAPGQGPDGSRYIRRRR
jgi:branched-chain amino acid transport system substrate-binding protein